ncbi:MAG: hypothetical protein A3J93_02280 [Candidatus Magasanikbacteria bacterium RIFOXYC2_FULL_42_28]|uniref:Gluconeogenesis factor n=1 Tax=Candidatus Magasanikbacteria bacterium RIFOXYC2_FULL_42_28 TaxID=1798704 RepID=A0A1F6NVY9_9BACT|nr:MAG: hypothetical protein A3J93_02280 [Candidatus Magasanikbacteria bacterium RIFOXYC2_FULL_42_28]
MEKKIKVVVVGGGNGSAITLQALKKYANNLDISAVIGTADSNGSSGRLRREFNVIPTGDILRAILSLSPIDYVVLRKIFYEVRFSAGGALKKHNLGNLFLTLGGQYSKNILNAIMALSESVGALGRVIPATLKPVDLAVQLDNGRVVKGEGNIDIPNYDRRFKIARALPSSGIANQDATRALLDADYIIFGPGSLYTSVIAPLMVKGIFNAVKQSRARLVFLLTNYNLIHGETGPSDLSDIIAHLEQHLPRPLDKIIFNSHIPGKVEAKSVKANGWYLIKCDDKNLSVYRGRLKFYDFGKKIWPGYDTERLGKYLRKIII